MYRRSRLVKKKDFRFFILQLFNIILIYFLLNYLKSLESKILGIGIYFLIIDSIKTSKIGLVKKFGFTLFIVGYISIFSSILLN